MTESTQVLNEILHKYEVSGPQHTYWLYPKLERMIEDHSG